MADRIVDEDIEEVPDIPNILEQVLIFALDEGKTKLEQGADLIPFTTLVVKENLFIETHPGDNPDECFALAKHTVENASGADAYAFCYDGYIDADEGLKDALIAEGGIPGEDRGYAICYLYTMDDDGDEVVFAFDPDPAYVGPAPNFMSDLKSTPSRSDENDDAESSPLDETISDQ